MTDFADSDFCLQIDLPSAPPPQSPESSTWNESELITLVIQEHSVNFPTLLS